MNRRKILLIAYQCGPDMGSVSRIGWEWYARLSGEHAVTLVTHVRNRPALEAAGAPLAGSEVVYIDTEWLAGPLYRLARRLFPKSEHSVFLLSSLDYFFFDFAAYRRIKNRLPTLDHCGSAWEVVHRVTPVTLAAPTWFARLGLPIVVGPLNSGLRNPSGFNHIMKQESNWLIRIRDLPRLLDTLIGSTRRTARILTASRATLEAVARRHRPLCRMMLENGVELSRFTATPWPPAPTADAPLKVLFAGRLVPIKGLDMLLRAIALLQREGLKIHLDVVGDGPVGPEWMALADRLGLGGQVIFHGAKPLDDVARHMQACHVFCLPSVRESGGGVLLEAMASARPVIALNFGGPGEIVDNDVGALLPLTDPLRVSADLAATLRDVWTNPETWRQRGITGRRRVEQRYSWPAKIAAAQDIYREVLLERESPCC